MCRVCEFPLCNYPPTISGYPLHILEPRWEETCHKSVQSEINGTEVGLQHSAGGAGTTLMRATGLSLGYTGASSGNFLKIWMTGSSRGTQRQLQQTGSVEAPSCRFPTNTLQTSSISSLQSIRLAV